MSEGKLIVKNAKGVIFDLDRHTCRFNERMERD